MSKQTFYKRGQQSTDVEFEAVNLEPNHSWAGGNNHLVPYTT